MSASTPHEEWRPKQARMGALQPIAMPVRLRRRRALIPLALAGLLLAATAVLLRPPSVRAAVGASPAAGAQQRAPAPARTGTSLESAAAKAGDTGRAVAMSLIGLAFAVAATVLAFRRDFKEAAAVFAVGIVSVLLATPTGVSLLRDTVASLFGSR
jgi:uncharacterized membrane protein